MGLPGSCPDRVDSGNMIHDSVRLIARLLRFNVPASLAALCWLQGGCAAPAGEDVLAIGPGQYEAAFDAAVDVARANGLSAALRDRRCGLIETDPAVTPSLLEPWHVDGATPATRMDNTIAHQRRVARFEFTPAGFIPPGEGELEALTGPDVLGLEPQRPDLTQTVGPLELRVWVYVERAHDPGLRRDTWSRRNTTRTRIVEPDGETLPATFWTPVARDRAFERRQLAAIDAAQGAVGAAR